MSLILMLILKNMSLILMLILKNINGTTVMRTGTELEHEQLVRGMVTSVNVKLEKKKKRSIIS